MKTSLRQTPQRLARKKSAAAARQSRWKVPHASGATYSKQKLRKTPQRRSRIKQTPLVYRKQLRAMVKGGKQPTDVQYCKKVKGISDNLSKFVEIVYTYMKDQYSEMCNSYYRKSDPLIILRYNVDASQKTKIKTSFQLPRDFWAKLKNCSLQKKRFAFFRFYIYSDRGCKHDGHANTLMFDFDKKRLVQQIVLVSGDSDFVPAAKVAIR